MDSSCSLSVPLPPILRAASPSPTLLGSVGIEGVQKPLISGMLPGTKVLSVPPCENLQRKSRGRFSAAERAALGRFKPSRLPRSASQPSCQQRLAHDFQPSGAASEPLNFCSSSRSFVESANSTFAHLPPRKQTALPLVSSKPTLHAGEVKLSASKHENESDLDHGQVSMLLNQLLPIREGVIGNDHVCRTRSRQSGERPSSTSLVSHFCSPPLPSKGSSARPASCQPALETESSRAEDWRATSILLPRIESRPTTRSGSESISAAPPQFGEAALERFRTKVLHRSRSLHDAFGKQCGRASFEKPLGTQQFRLSLLRLAEDDHVVDDFLSANTRMSDVGPISMAMLFKALAGLSATALLWEFRCCLADNGFLPIHLHIDELLSLLRRGSKLRSRCVGACAGRSASNEEIKVENTSARGPVEEESAPRAKQTSEELGCVLGFREWLELAVLIGLTPFEARGLFNLMRTTFNVVDLRTANRLVSGTVGPDASLTSLVAKMAERHGSVRNAFSSACSSAQDFLKWPQFLKVTGSLGVSEVNARKLWDVQCADSSASSVEMTSTVSDVFSLRGFSEEEFVDDMLRYARAGALSKLQHQLCEEFGSLSEGRRALRQHGLQGGSSLSPKRFSAGLRSAGCSCDADLVLATVRASRDNDIGCRLTLDDVIGTMHDERLQASPGDRMSVVVRKETQDAWQQLHAVRADLLMVGRESSARNSRASTALPSPAPSWSPSPAHSEDDDDERASDSCRQHDNFGVSAIRMPASSELSRQKKGSRQLRGRSRSKQSASTPILAVPSSGTASNVRIAEATANKMLRPRPCASNSNSLVAPLVL